MRSDYVLAGETLNALAARLRVPACMLMRANGLFSPAWLLPGREVLVPEGACGGAFPCPREVFHRVVGQCAPRRRRALPAALGGGLVFIYLPEGAPSESE